MIANAAPSSVTSTTGVLRGRGSMNNPGGRADSVVVNLAVQKALTGGAPVKCAPVGVQVTAAPRFVLPLLNWTVPVGPCAELLCVFTVAVSVMLPPETTLVTFGVTFVVVAAWVIVTERVLLLEFE